jgi:hypothetical protein
MDGRETALRAIRFVVQHPLADPGRLTSFPLPDPDDPRLFLGFREQAEHIRGRLCFPCTLDAQSTMPSADRPRIAAEATDIVRGLLTPSGGLMASIYGDPSSYRMDDEVPAFGVEAYRRACERFPEARKGAAS